MELFLVFVDVLVVLDVYVELVEGDLNTIVIELGFYLFENVEVNGPIIRALCPCSSGDVDGACVVCYDTYGGSLFLDSKLVLSEDLGDDRLCLFKVVVVADGEGEVDAAKLVFGIVYDIAVCECAIGNVDYLVIAGEDTGAGEADILHYTDIALCLDHIVDLKGSGDDDEKAACDVGYCTVNSKT